MQRWYQYVTPEDLTGAHRKLMDALDIPEILRLCEVFGGANLYIPKNDEVYNRAVRNKEIRRKYLSGATLAALARQYNVSESSVQRIVKGCAPGQISLFEEQPPEG